MLNLPIKLTFLELNGHMLHLVAFANECSGKYMATRIDNSGTGRIWEIILMCKYFTVIAVIILTNVTFNN